MKGNTAPIHMAKLIASFSPDNNPMLDNEIVALFIENGHSRSGAYAQFTKAKALGIIKFSGYKETGRRDPNRQYELSEIGYGYREKAVMVLEFLQSMNRLGNS